MDYHLERRLRVNAKPKHGGLYRWAINEIDAKGQVFSEDLIPWVWTQYFTATSCVLGDVIRLEQSIDDEDNPTYDDDPARSQVIRVQLSPSEPSQRQNRITSYSMFGTDRDINTFQLDIRPLTDATEREHCRALGFVSYTSEGADFLNQTQPDFLGFTFCIAQNDFARLAKKISAGEVHEIAFSVKLVRGFYAEWSPDISTRYIKVLTPNKKDHVVETPQGFTHEPPRLGEVGSAELSINQKIEFVAARKVVDDDEDPPPVEHKIATTAPRARPAGRFTDGQVQKIISSLTNAVWLVVVLLTVIVGILLNR